MNAPHVKRTAARLVGVAALAVVYFAAAKLGLRLAFVQANASAVWPPTGIALAALLLFGPRMWPGVFVGAVLANVTTAGGLASSIGIATGNTLEAVVGAMLVARYANGARAFERLPTVFAYVGVAAVLATAISATVGVTTLAAFGHADWRAFGSIWLTWWLGDAGGALIVAPLLLLWARVTAAELRAHAIERALLLGCVLLVAAAAFWSASPVAGRQYPFATLALPVLIWAASRFGPRETTATTFLLSAFALWGTLVEIGPFVGDSTNESLLRLQTFMGVATVSSLALAAAVLDRERTAAALRATEEQLRLTAERDHALEGLAVAQAVAHVGSWEWDIPADRVTWSDELWRIYGLAEAQFTPTYDGFLERVHPEDRARVAEIIGGAYQTHAPVAFFHRIVRPGGETRVLHARGEVVTDDAGTPVRMIGTGHDVTELREAQLMREALERERTLRAEAEAAVTARDEFLAIAAHELRTPLSGLQGAVQLVLRRTRRRQAIEPDALQRSLETVERESLRLGRLVTGLLETTRLDGGRFALDRRDEDVSQIVRQAAERIHGSIDGHHLLVDAPAGHVAYIDALRIEQVIGNLLDNAIKYSPDGGTIELRVERRAPDALVLTIRDHGIGIPESVLPHVFDRFFQAHADSNRSGLGLGLYVSRRIVEQHGGDITVSLPGDGGTRFEVVLPVSAPAGTS